MSKYWGNADFQGNIESRVEASTFTQANTNEVASTEYLSYLVLGILYV